jgi:hypothetical protein
MAFTGFEIAAIVSMVVGSTATVMSTQASQEAAEDQQEQQEAQAFEQRQAATRKRVRERRIQEARIRQAGENQGVSGSSGEAGALGSLASQFATGVSADAFAQQQSDALGDIQNKLAKKQTQAAFIGAAGKIGGAVASAGEEGLFD